jgi:hypothetical protein
MTNPSFIAFDWKNGQLFFDQHSDYPVKLHALVGSNTFDFKKGSTYFVYQYAGYSFINSNFPLPAGYYAVENQGYIHGDNDSKAIIIESIGKHAPFLLGGPIEREGRLKYIDGCTDSLLIAPWKFGEPCLNHLHFPANIVQTMHTHPSIRIGLVAKGSGLCVTPFGNIPLQQGMLFAILPENGHQVKGLDGHFHDEGEHCFSTFDGEMDVIAFHPDSDYGPKDEEHPMINRTIVNGTSAKNIDEIRTKG